MPYIGLSSYFRIGAGFIHGHSESSSPDITEDKLSRIMHMGFRRSEAEGALKKADGNVKKAVETMVEMESRTHIYDYEALYFAKYLYQVCLFLDRQYGDGDGKWADVLFTGNGDAWALRTFANKFVMFSYVILTALEWFRFGHYTPYHSAITIGMVIVLLKALQLVGIIQA